VSTVWQALGRALSPVEDRPCIAADLESASYHTRAGAQYVVIRRGQAYARLDPREFELLPLMDGRRTVKELVIAYYQRHGVLALARVAGLVGLLYRQGFLRQARVDAYATLARRLRGNAPITSRELSTMHVDAAFGTLYHLIGHYFFHRAWLWMGVLLGVTGPAIVILELVSGRYALYDPGASGLITILVLIAFAVLALAIHEVGHGLAVKHAGRSVHSAGVRLYLGLPAAFVDTTDIWMAPPLQRLLTAFAGPWTGLVFGGVLAISAIFVSGQLLFTAAFVFLVDNLFNFNPLLELDGYYMLIDVLDRPLLRSEALAFVRGPLWTRLWRRAPLSHDEKLLSLFGLAAIAYSLLAIGLAVRAWQSLLAPLVITNLTSGDLPRQIFGFLVLLLILVVVVSVVAALVRRVVDPMQSWLAWLSGRAARYRYREALATLREVPLWSELPPGRLLEVARAMRLEHVPTGSEVIRQGDIGDRFYLVARGGFEVRVDEVPQVRLGRADFFGERALLQRAPRAATVVATESAEVLVLERGDFEHLLASDLAARARIDASLAYRDEVAAMPLFRDISPTELDALLAHLEALTFQTGEAVIHQGDRADRFYIVRSGRLTVERDGAVLAHLGPGEAFGEIALLLDVPRTATITASEPTSLLALDAQHFRDVLASYLGRAPELQRLSHLRLRSHKRLDEVV
jgi:CRP-like cAMP-binding protein